MKACLAALTLLSLVVAPAAAQDPYSLPDTQVHQLPESANGISYQLYVRVPPACQEAEGGCPVVYLLDAEYSFAIAANITQHLADRNRIPHLIVVSIAYPQKDDFGYRYNRSRDYTPIFDPDDAYGPTYQAESGGGPAFLSVIEQDIIPFVEANFPAAERPRTLVGHSYGGLFALYTVLDKPDLFDQTIAVSPSLWYADRWMFAREHDRTLPSTTRRNRVYSAVGSFEEQAPPSHAMVSDLRAFHARMDAWDPATVEHRMDVLDGETHASVFPRALSTGLRALFQ